MSDLFGAPAPSGGPLADRMRPSSFDEFVGQEDVVRAIRKFAARPPSMILWGPPGCGKTTLARLAAAEWKLPFLQFSAVTSGIKDVKEAVETARRRRSAEGRSTILFVDEIHRFNRAQQDAFLGPIEDGTIVLIGATTENPSFEVNAPLLSRCRVFRLEPLGPDPMRSILERAARREGIEAQIGTYALHRLQAYREQGPFPGADRAYERALALPFSSTLREDEVERVVRTLARFL